MNNLLEKDTVKRVEFFLKKFNPNLKIIILKKTARTARDAASSLKCNLGAIIKINIQRSGSTRLEAQWPRRIFDHLF